jgi:hypothetical protein
LLQFVCCFSYFTCLRVCSADDVRIAEGEALQAQHGFAAIKVKAETIILVSVFIAKPGEKGLRMAGKKSLSWARISLRARAVFV